MKKSFKICTVCICIAAVAAICFYCLQFLQPSKNDTDKTALSLLIDECNTLVPITYTENAWNAFKNVLASAQQLKGNAKATQSSIDTMVIDLGKARNVLLTHLRANLTTLNAKIIEANNKQSSAYETTNWTEFETALATAKTISAKNANAEAAEAKLALSHLTTALNNIIPLNPKRELQLLYDAKKTITNGGGEYTLGSFRSLENALEHAKSVLDNQEATKAQIANAYEALDTRELFLCNKNKPLNTPPPIASPVIINIGANAADIQAAFNAASAGAGDGYVVFQNNGVDENATIYEVTEQLSIPNGIKVYGMGATVSMCVDSQTGLFIKHYRQGAPSEAAIVSNGMITGNINETFEFYNINFEMNVLSLDSVMPKTLFMIGGCTNVKLIDCGFTCNSIKEVSIGPFDAYRNWTNLTIKGCTFRHETDSEAGGVWIRNLYGTIESGNALIEDCEFYKRAGDEALAIWAGIGANGPLKNITVRDCRFYCETSAYNNPAYLLTCGLGAGENSGATSNISFINNYIYMETVALSIMHLGADTNFILDEINMENNKIVVDGSLSPSTYLIWGHNYTSRDFIFNNNEVSFYAKNGIRKESVLHGITTAMGNTFRGDGYVIAGSSVVNFENNTILSCITGGQSVKNFINNEVHFRPWVAPSDSLSQEYYNCFRVLSNGTDGAEGHYVIKGNTFYGNERRVGKNTIIQINSYNNVELIDNTFFNLTILNSFSQTKVQYKINKNTFYNGTLGQLGISGSDVVFTEFQGNMFLNVASGADLLNISAPPSTGLPVKAPIGATILFKQPVNDISGYIRTENGWELF